MADSVRAALTDEAVEAAVRALPEPVFEKNGAEMIQRLKKRRDKLPRVAEKYYGVLACVVDVIGSDKHERFEVQRLPGGETNVVVFKTSKEGEIDKEIYRRTFYPSETKEIRLYGLGGRDQFVVQGDVRRGIRVRAIGGSGEDVFADASRVRGWGKKTYVYDTVTSENTWETGPETNVTRTDDPDVNLYDAGAYQHNTLLPVAAFGSNETDGPFVGGGVGVVRHGFRKTPYAALHQITARYATWTSALGLAYGGHFVSVLGPWDVRLDAGLLAPGNVRNFYGLGNETGPEGRDAEYYQARLARLDVRVALGRQVEPGLVFSIGPTFHVTDVEQDDQPRRCRHERGPFSRRGAARDPASLGRYRAG